MSEREAAVKYLRIVRSYTHNSSKQAEEFSIEYMEEFKNEDEDLSDELFWILETLFAEADAYCHDPELRGEHHINEQELQTAAREAEDDLEQWLNDHAD